ncbi:MULTISPECIES: FtsK/SpoIIIE domain-containing protein [unclassified Curtobacterium]|uniref:FtsK/SpoIIIE domain-containing protein n=1 Tax=unclassified Curtobacterium TaxID=257496 RepID=UPI000F47294F|nr:MULTISPECIES: FtsK/SpoIIIE domain-containing protein [unclassified Curtobacterium]ROQ05043.1 S-DNA-T family DNA segregation ATPase FtsK/SpoIIIE [Curtobacterium sp. PhB171]ROQ22245.1 S-DNA-T family DNA segregation ATPase FtsK/SpoIIIE [Curtobacterium sp. PhB170]ROS33605.1 S-DNA-T family DNA segregation ATPase FtsK/SpoIIIE [Curtobacterium sp. PhB131]ROS64923.1 S-DNA-T family DNA segregation ATPase FtsK/SpoIIIE [Curtobacterium sp. PhB141]
MRLLIELDDRREAVEVDGWSGASSLGELIAAAIGVELDAETTLAVDGHRTSAATPLRDLVLLEGSRIGRAPQERPQTIDGWSVTLAGGLDAGLVVPVPRSRKLVVGRAPQADVVLPTESASWEHCTIEREDDGVRVRDAGSTNGTVIAGERIDAEGVLLTGTTSVILGGAVLLVRPALDEVPVPAAGSLANLTPAATAPFNRPPRAGRTSDAEMVVPPGRKDVPPASKFSWITVAAPLVLAGAMVLLLGDARFALFALLSPVTAIGMWFEQKHRRAKNLKEEETRFAEAVESFRGEISEAAAVEAARRQELVPDPATVVRRAEVPTTLLWQRRSDDEDFLSLHAGTGDAPWRPEVDHRAASAKLEDEAKAAIADSRLTAAPVVADLSDAGVVGIVGDRQGALALARSLLTQATVHCGPADLTVGVFCDAGRAEDWGWASWLPHARVAGSSTGARWMSAQRDQSAAMLRGLRESLDELPTPNLLVVVDSEVLTEGRDAPARNLLGQGRSVPGQSLRPGERPRRVSGIVIATNEQQLPAACTSIITVGADAAATVYRPEDRTRVEDVVLAGLSVETAERSARSVAHFDDPELTVPGASLPSLVRLPELLSSEGIRTAWDARTGFSTPIGSSESGVLEIDLVRDGPHGLVGGTTGSGKSEFLRSLVAGLAARNDPTRLNFLLVDFKGGAAFAACERLPHTIGTISNLDEQLADRAIRALEAELERRQRVFAAAGADIDNLDAYLATKPVEPMPRLLLVVDEFAMLAKDFPDVLTSLVSIAAVGRTLGVHMILATQRPAGVVSEDILANTNMRVALRVQSREDSTNVIGVPAAAGIGRQQTGRAYVKLGQDDITPVQTALVTGRARDERAEQPVSVRPTDVFGVPAPMPAPAPTASDVTDLDQLIEAIGQANAAAGYAPPRPIWPEALGDRVELAALTAPGPGTARGPGTDPRPTTVTVALADDPDHQRQVTSGWDLDEGNLMLMGIPGSGTSTALATIALQLAASSSPDELDLLVLDMGPGDLAPLAQLPHTTAYVGSGAGAGELQTRFLRHLRVELERRRAAPGGRRAVVLIDGLAALRDEYQEFEGQQLLDALYRVYAEGPALGISFAVSTTRAKAVPSAMDEVTTQKWMFRLADPYDYASIGVRPKDVPPPVPGRFIDSTRRLQSHVATPDVPLAEAVARIAEIRSGSSRKASAVGRLPDAVLVDELGTGAVFAGEPWRIPIGIAEDDLQPASVEVYDGEHVLVAGPARSGKSSVLLAVAELARTAEGVRPAVWAICDRRSPLASGSFDRIAVGPDEVPALLAGLRLERGPVLLLIDDAERFEDGDQAIATLLTTERPGLCVVAAGRSADLRSLYSHWTRAVRKSRCGVLLQPDVDYDGELLGVTLPRRAPVALTVGRGYASSGGAVRLVQTASAGN